VVAALALAGCGSSSSGGSGSVSVQSYAKSICNAIGPWHTDAVKRAGALNPTGVSNPAAGKRAIEGMLSVIATDTDTALTQLKAAGTPNVANGSKISSALVGAFQTMKSAAVSAQSQAASLPTSSVTAFRTGALSIGISYLKSFSGIAKSLEVLNQQDLSRAINAEPACKGLSSGG
jgi:hypothetical protein